MAKQNSSYCIKGMFSCNSMCIIFQFFQHTLGQKSLLDVFSRRLGMEPIVIEVFLCQFFCTEIKIESISYLHSISTFTSVCPYGVCPLLRHPSVRSHFLQLYYKISRLKVAWHVLRVKNAHSWLPSDLLGS